MENRSHREPIAEFVTNAARNDLPREALSYADGLVMQVKEILDRHGVMLEDLKSPEVRERIPTEDLKRLRELATRNAAVRRGEVDSAARREITSELDERERDAERLLADALAGLEKKVAVGERLVNWYLRAGMIAEARSYLNAFGNSDPLAIETTSPGEWSIAIDEAEGIAFASTDPEQSARLLESVADRSRVVINPAISDYGGAFTRFARMLPDARFLRLASDVERMDDTRLPVAVCVMELEAERRKIALPVSLASAKNRGEELTIGDTDVRVSSLLAMARVHSAFGKNPVPYLDWALSVASRDRKDEYLFAGQMAEVAETSAMVADTALVNKILEEAAETDEGETNLKAHRIAMTGAIGGFAQAGKFDDATSLINQYIDSHGSESRDFGVAVARTMAAMFDRGEIERALELSRSDFGGAATEMKLRKNTEREYVAALARRGEDALDILSRMQSQTASGPFARPASTRALDVANAAIATIGYVRDARKRLATYGSIR